jgi:ribosomal protein S18 acetylase RimI-like enzyme
MSGPISGDGGASGPMGSGDAASGPISGGDSANGSIDGGDGAGGSISGAPAASTAGAVEIRPARVDDLEAVERLLGQSFGQSSDSAFAGLAADEQVQLRLALRQLEPDPTDGLFVAADAASIVGVVGLVTAENASRPGLAALRVLRRLGVLGVARFFATALASDYRPGADEAYLYGLAVAPTHRRRGLGERLLRAVQQESSRRGKRVLSAFVAPTNRASLSLCERQGFRRQRAPGAFWRRLTSRRGSLHLRMELA